MKYLLYYEWLSTKGNHAGMAHMCKLLKQEYSNEYEIIKTSYPRLSPYKGNSSNRIKYVVELFIKNINRIISRCEISGILQIWIALRLCLKLKQEDSVFLLEYLIRNPKQEIIASIIQKLKPSVKIVGLSHLTPLSLNDKFSKSEILDQINKVDYIATLGSSLSSYFVNIGVSTKKVKTLFHYVDIDYYKPKYRYPSQNIRVIVIGSMQRNDKLLVDIVKNNPNIHFIICRGRRETPLFENFSNVKLLGYISEDELKKEMNNSDASLNVMNDTVGSNVITTSMAMGLAIVVSDVGSIRDYCSHENARFCINELDYSEALKMLQNNRQLLLSMQSSSLEKAEKFKINNFHKVLSDI